MYQYLISQATFDREEHTRGGGLPDQVVCAFCLPFESVELYNCQVFCLLFVNISFRHFNILLYLRYKNIFTIKSNFCAYKILPSRCWLEVLNKLSIYLTPFQQCIVWQKIVGRNENAVREAGMVCVRKCQVIKIMIKVKINIVIKITKSLLNNDYQ